MTRPAYTARFTPQAWINDNATDVDPEGEQTWDCTDAVEENDGYFEDLFDGVDGDEVVDRDDRLAKDPHAPQWIRNWKGPFVITVTRPPKQEWQVIYTPMTVMARTAEEAIAKAEDSNGGGQWDAEPVNTRHTFTVTVAGCTVEQAKQVMAERLGHDEDYGFGHDIDWETSA